MKRILLPFLTAFTLFTTHAAAQSLKYEDVPNFFEAQPGGTQTGPCHGGVALDKAGSIYVTTETQRGILVFSAEGKFQRAVGPAKIHALKIREEGGTEFIYAARGREHEVLKLRLDGTQEWSLKYPEESAKSNLRACLAATPQKSRCHAPNPQREEARPEIRIRAHFFGSRKSGGLLSV